jgi:hypothetical protein
MKNQEEQRRLLRERLRGRGAIVEGAASSAGSAGSRRFRRCFLGDDERPGGRTHLPRWLDVLRRANTDRGAGGTEPPAGDLWGEGERGGRWPHGDGPNLRESYRQAATYVDKILKGANLQNHPGGRESGISAPALDRDLVTGSLKQSRDTGSDLYRF